MATAEFSKFAGILTAALLQHHLLGFEIAQLEWNCQNTKDWWVAQFLELSTPSQEQLE